MKSETRKILVEHSIKYPKMQPADAVKLLYQGHFGGEHLITDRDRFISYLHSEYESTNQSECSDLVEDIGFGIVRINLSALDANGIDINTLINAFFESVGKTSANASDFMYKLEVLRETCADGLFGFDISTLDEFLSAYTSLSCPAISHSDEYKNAYSPAYRIVKLDVWEHVTQIK